MMKLLSTDAIQPLIDLLLYHAYITNDFKITMKYLKHVIIIVKQTGHDGRAGMASIILKDKEEISVDKLNAIYNHLEQKLPKYARPIVIRFERKMRTTGTFKNQKGDLMKEGFDPNIVPDPMYYLSTEAKAYVPLDKGSYHHMLQSKL